MNRSYAYLITYQDLIPLIKELDSNRNYDYFVNVFEKKYIDLQNKSKQVVVLEDYYNTGSSLIMNDIPNKALVEKELLRAISKRQYACIENTMKNVLSRNVDSAIYEFIDFIYDYNCYSMKKNISLNEKYLIDLVVNMIHELKPME